MDCTSLGVIYWCGLMKAGNSARINRLFLGWEILTRRALQETLSKTHLLTIYLKDLDVEKGKVIAVGK